MKIKVMLVLLLVATMALAQDAPVSTFTSAIPQYNDLLYLVKNLGGTWGSRKMTVADMDDGVRHATRFPGSDTRAKIQAAIDNLPAGGGVVDARGFEGAQTLSANVDMTAKPVTLLLSTGSTYTLSAASFVLGTGSVIDGGGPMCRNLSLCATIKRTTGTQSMITATGTDGTHVRGFALRNLYVNGGGTAGHGAVLDYVDTFTIDNVQFQNGGGSNALRILNYAADFTVSHSAFVIWGNTTTPTVALVGLDGTHQITDGHWIGNQLGEGGTGGNPILTANTLVLNQWFVNNKFHWTDANMPYMVNFQGYRSSFVQNSFQDEGSVATRLLEIGNAATTVNENLFIVLGSTSEDAIRLTGNDQAGATISHNWLMSGGPGTGVGIRLLAGGTGASIAMISGNWFQSFVAAVRNEGSGQIIYSADNNLQLTTSAVVEAGTGVYPVVHIANALAVARSGQLLDLGNNSTSSVLLNPAATGTINIRTNSRLTQGANNDNTAGAISIAAATTASKTFSTAFANAPSCTATPIQDMTTTTWWVTSSTTAVTVHINPSGSATFTYHCIGNPN